MNKFLYVFALSLLVLIVNVYSQNPEPVKQEPRKRPSANKIYNSPECQEDIQKYCPRAKKFELNDLAILQCIYNEVQDLKVIDGECQSVIIFKINILLAKSLVVILIYTYFRRSNSQHK